MFLEQTTVISLNSINLLLFITEARVFTARYPMKSSIQLRFGLVYQGSAMA